MLIRKVKIAHLGRVFHAIELYISICLFLLGAQKSHVAVERAPKTTPKHDLKITKNRVWLVTPPHHHHPRKIQSKTQASLRPSSEISSTTPFLNPKHTPSELKAPRRKLQTRAPEPLQDTTSELKAPRRKLKTRAPEPLHDNTSDLKEPSRKLQNQAPDPLQDTTSDLTAPNKNLQNRAREMHTLPTVSL